MSNLNSLLTVARPAPRAAHHLENLVADLRRAFGNDFTILDAGSGELLHTAPIATRADWSVRAELCREVARRGRPEFLEEDDPFTVLALPIALDDRQSLVAVGTFLTRSLVIETELPRLATQLGCTQADARVWAEWQVPMPAVALARMAQTYSDGDRARQRNRELGGEVDKLAAQINSTYEEITLIYRLTQNLKISGRLDELARSALSWLAEVVPADGLAIWLTIDCSTPIGEERGPAEPTLLTHGRCPLDANQFKDLLARQDVRGAGRPRVINRNGITEAAEIARDVNQMILVPLAEGENLFGYLAAFNHANGAEFGSIEANLMSSVGTILGIHVGNTSLYRQQAELLTGIVRALTSAIDAKDPYTRGHSDRVARVSVCLARELGCDHETLKTLYFSGLLHDIGKIGIEDSVLRKPGKLSDAEFDHIKTHTEIGYRILKDLKKMGHVLPIVLHHHESWDGQGYPFGLAGENIPYLARIAAVADAYDAMSSDRPYRKGMEDDRLDEIFRRGAGQQWDPNVVDAFFRVRDEIRAITHRDENGPEMERFHWT